MQPTIDGVEHRIGDGRDNDDEQHQPVHLAVLEIVVGVGDLVADALARQDEFRGDHPDEGIGESELDAGEQMRCGCRQIDQQCAARKPHPIDRRGLAQHARDAVEPGQGRGNHGDDRQQHGDGDDRAIADAEHDDEHRIEHEGRDRVIAREQRLQRRAQSRERVDGDAERKTQRDR